MEHIRISCGVSRIFTGHLMLPWGRSTGNYHLSLRDSPRADCCLLDTAAGLRERRCPAFSYGAPAIFLWDLGGWPSPKLYPGIPDWMWRIFGRPCVTARCGEMLWGDSRPRPKDDDDDDEGKIECWMNQSELKKWYFYNKSIIYKKTFCRFAKQYGFQFFPFL